MSARAGAEMCFDINFLLMLVDVPSFLTNLMLAVASSTISGVQHQAVNINFLNGLTAVVW